MTPLPATQALDAFFLEARARLLDLAAILDRIGRGTDPAAALADPRAEKLRRALEILLTMTDGRAEAVQQLFSLDYDPAWTRPKPR
ncbi:MAG TPA: hypothetical protein VFG68_07850 [Fimbriiglobus sp.]|nr:hypothetical protein [Fimbriiglobus sp.]